MPVFAADTYLNTFLNWEPALHQARGASFALDGVRRLLEAFGYPDGNLRLAHVAGTKGKGSTCAFLASILRAGGYRVGLYTSPHVHSLCERIRVLDSRRAGAGLSREDGILWDELSALLEYHHDAIEKLRADGAVITFFELMTVLAAAYFASQKVQVAVLETGLGGRLDATNVFETQVCGIAPVGFDHMDILGHGLADIAGEKAGIIRSSQQRVVVAPQGPEAQTVLMARCAEFGIRPTLIGEDMPVRVHQVRAEGVTFEVHGRRAYKDLFSPLTGSHQAWNAALAIGMAEELEMYGFLLTEESVRQGIADVRWPARFEKISSAPVVILDCAHTAESAAVLAAAFEAAYPGRKAVVVLGMSSDKDPDAVIRALEPVTGSMIFTRADTPRALDLAGRASLVKAPCHVTEDVAQAMAGARDLAGDDGIILVTGSIFVCAQVNKA